MQTKVIRIDSEQSAATAIKQALADGFGGRNVELKFEHWPRIQIKLEGKGYQSSITSPVASAIVDLQSALNRSYALLVHGQNSANRLTDEERNSIQFKAQVKKGSTDILVDLAPYLQKVITHIGDRMTPEGLVVTVLGLAGIAASTVAYKSFLKSRTEDKQIEADSEKQIALSTQETARLQIFADALKEKRELLVIRENFDDARTSILKSTSDADSLTVNDVQVDRETARLAVVNARSPMVDVQLNGTYFVTETNLRKPDEIRLGLRRAQDGKEFTASFKDHSLDLEQIKLLQAAEWERKEVYLSINATERKGEITKANVISVSESVAVPRGRKS
jgi:hypothetical protein